MSNLSYKTLLIIVTLLSVLIVFFLKIRGNPWPARAAWYSNSWNYRQPVTVTYSGTTLTNSDILITLDTATLISAGKMQSDCDDLRITDSDEVSLVTHWIEAGCNTATTQIWARIPSISTGGKTIYAYYGNSGASNNEASWTGNFILMGSTDCPTGWTRYTAMDNRFPYGAASAGTTGGDDAPAHPQVNVTSSTFTGTMQLRDGYSDSVAITHSHTGTIANITTSTVLPPYISMVFCSKSRLDIGTSLISAFTTTTPTGWTRFSPLDSRFPRGSTTYGTTGGATTHTHSFTGTTTGACTSTFGSATGGSITVAYPNHTHTTNGGTTGSADNTPPYLTMIYASKNSAGIGSSGMVLMSTALPPLGWTRFSSLDSKFPQGSATYGTSGGATTHTHTVSITTGGASALASKATVTAGSGSCDNCAQQHTHTATGYTTASNLPAYSTIIFSQRNSPVPTTSLGAEDHLNLIPNLPTLILPNDTAISQSLTPTFKTVTTDSDGDYLQYELKICTDSGMTTGCQTFDQTSSNVGWSGQDVGTSAFASGTTATYILQVGNSLSFNTTYYWKTRATDPGGYAFRYLDGTNTWSSTQASPFSFATNYSPNIPILISPTDLATTQPLTPTTFRLVATDVDTDALQYKIKLCQNSAMNLNCLTFNQNTTSIGWSGQDVGTSAFASGTTATYIYSGSLTPDITYYWQGYALDPNGTNLWSATQASPFSFSTANLPAPQNCLIEESTNETWLKIKWIDTSPSETGYSLDRKVDGGAYSNLTTLAAGTTDFTDSNISSGHTYQYRVAPILPGPIYGQWCETGTLNLTSPLPTAPGSNSLLLF